MKLYKILTVTILLALTLTLIGGCEESANQSSTESPLSMEETTMTEEPTVTEESTITE